MIVVASFPNAYSLQGAAGVGALSSAAGSQLEGEKLCFVCNRFICTAVLLQSLVVVIQTSELILFEFFISKFD